MNFFTPSTLLYSTGIGRVSSAPPKPRHGHHPSGSWSGGRAISCDMAGRSGLLCTRTRNLQIESLVCDCLEDEGPFTLG